MLCSWVELRESCPVDISRIVSYAGRFNSCVNIRISTNNLNRAKKSLLDARGNFDLMVTTLQQLIYDRQFLKNKTDEVLYAWLIDNLGRYLKIIDEKETDLLIDYDRPDANQSRIGISRLSSYAKILKIASQSLIYETLYKSIEEYNNFEAGDEIKKEPRTFLYILFHILQITLFALGGLAREKNGKGTITKRGIVNSYPSSWQSMMGKEGQQQIADTYKEETGNTISIPTELIDNSQSGSDSGDGEELEFYDEFIEGDENVSS